MIVHNYYPTDVRVRREAETLIETGMSVDVICLRKEYEQFKEEINGVRLYRINLTHKRGSTWRYLFEYAYFFFRVFLKLTILHLRKRYHIIHVHNMPDILVFAALFPRLTGAKILLDLHDPTPEVYMAKYLKQLTHPVIKILCLLEKLSIQFSHQVITPNKAFKERFISRGCPPGKIDIVMNTPMEKIFHGNITNHKSIKPSNNQKFVIMFHGSIVERHGLTTVLKVLNKVRKKTPNLLFKVYGEGDFVEKFINQVKEFNLSDIVEYNGWVPNEKIGEAILEIDVGLISNDLNPFTEINFPTRIFEYLSLDKPVIVPRTQGILDYFDDDSINFFNPGDVDSLVNVILRLYHKPAKQQKILERGVNVYNQYRWETQKQHFIDIIISLIDRKSMATIQKVFENTKNLMYKDVPR